MLILAGIGLFLVSALVVVADVWGDPGASIVGSIAVYAVGAALAWLAGRRRASGQVVTGGYVAYVVLYLMALGVMVYLSSGAARWWGLIPLVWLACFIAVVELSCIWRRRLYWSGWN
ncbi:hypothetical protein [Janibacter sp. G368]|uniref:hypothetical protein n=1 Tax=Janibacter sp. G368 TaxID=3420441 RepID=UPI003CFF25B0